jgi:hypothetical protein
MTEPFILTPEELKKLTGKMRYSAQARELNALGIPFRKRTNGSLVVLRSVVEPTRPPSETPVSKIRLRASWPPEPKRGRR